MSLTIGNYADMQWQAYPFGIAVFWSQRLLCLRNHWGRNCACNLNAHNVDDENVYEHRIS